MIFLFVYGTFMNGEAASSKLESCKYCGVYRLADYGLYQVNVNYPGIVPQIGESVIGEVYEIDEKLLPVLDEYEGEGFLYNRKTVMLSREYESIYGITYVYNREVNKKDLIRNKWNVKSSDYVWYAGYGSNLSTERFLCYVKGGICAENGSSYSGCTDKSMWIAEREKRYSGRMYFARESSKWGNKGVSFYEPSINDFTFMKLYKITWDQFNDIRKQEGLGWYNRVICLDVLDDSCPVFTITAEQKQSENLPAENYFNLLKLSLEKMLGDGKKTEVENYLNACLNDKSDIKRKFMNTIFKAYKFDAELNGNIVRISDGHINYSFDITDKNSIEQCRELMSKDYKAAPDFELFYEYFVLGKNMKSIRK